MSASRLQVPLSHDPAENDKETEEDVINEISKLVEHADGSVIVIVDACTIRHNVKKEVREFLDATHFPVYAAPMGKTAINEDYERYGGVRRSFCRDRLLCLL